MTQVTGIIYKLIVGPYFYVGRSTRRFKSRYNSHKKACFNKRKSSYHSKIYKIMRLMGVTKNNWNDTVKWKIVYNCPIEYLECYERHCINISVDNKWCINTKFISIDKIYKKDIVRKGLMTKEELLETRRAHYRKNAEKLTKIKRDKRQQNKEKIQSMDRARYLKNRDIKLQQKKAGYIRNKEKIKLQKQTYKRHKCNICNTILMTLYKYKRHCKSKKHIQNIQL